MMCSWPPGQALSLSGVQCKHLLYQVEDGQSTFLDVQVCSLSQRVDCKVRCVQANGGNCDTGWDSQVLCAPWPHAFNLRVFSTQFRKSCRERPAILALLWKLDFSVLESFGTQDTDLRCWFIPSKRHYTCIFAFIVLVINGIHDALMLLLCRGLQVIHTVWSWPALSDFLMEIYKPKQLKYRMYIHHCTSKLGSGAFCWRPSLCVSVAWCYMFIAAYCNNRLVTLSFKLLVLDRGAAVCSFGAKLSPKACGLCDVGRSGSVDRCCQVASAVLYRSRLGYEWMWYVSQGCSLSCVGCWGPSWNVASGFCTCLYHIYPYLSISWEMLLCIAGSWAWDLRRVQVIGNMISPRL